MATEVWKNIEGFKGYQVSNLGKVRSRKGHGDEWRIMKQGYGDGRYRQVVLMQHGIPVTKRVHRLVAEAFLANPEGKPQVDHIDGNSYNCVLENLRYVTPTQNCSNPNTKERNRGSREEQRANRRNRLMAQRLERMRDKETDYICEDFDLVYDCARDCYMLYVKKTVEVDDWIYTCTLPPETYYVEDFIRDGLIDYATMWEAMWRYLESEQ